MAASTAVKEIGVVVIGLGIAGKVRVRDLKEKACSFVLRGVVSRRPVEIEGVTGVSLEDAFSRKDVDAIMICTENKLHEEYVQRGLENGKHVLIDYPVALSSAKAKELYTLADQKGLILQEESIALLTGTHLMVKDKAEKVGLKCANHSTSGGFNGWIEKLEESGSPFISGISTLHVLMDLFGDLRVVGGKLEKTEDSHTATASLETMSGKSITASRSRKNSKEASRKKSVSYEFEDGELMDPSKLVVPPSSPPKPGLFMQDMLMFHDAIVKGENDKAARQRSIRSLEIAEAIEAFF